MAGIKKYCIILILWLTFYPASLFAQRDSLVSQYWNRDPNTDVSRTTSNQKQIITAEQIMLSGYSRLSDVLQLVDAWTFATRNGDKWLMQSNALGTLQLQNWILMIDGFRVNVNQTDAIDINQLGVIVPDIERIEIINAVGNYLGEFNDKGIIHIITKNAKRGLSYQLFYSNGNETGDPNLSRYSANASPNVDKYGQNTFHQLGIRYGKWTTKFTLGFQNYFLRDSGLLFLSDYSTKNTIENIRFHQLYAGKKWIHQLDILHAFGEDYYSIYPLPAALQLRYKSGTVSYQLRYQMPKGNLTMRFAVSRQMIDIDRLVGTSNIAYTRYGKTKRGQRVFQTGIAGELYQYGNVIETSNYLSPVNFRLAKFLGRGFVSLTEPLSKKSNLFADISVASNGVGIAPKVSVGYYKQPTIISNYSFILAYIQRYQLENRSSILFNDLVNDTKSSQATFDFFYNLNIGRYFKVSYNSGLRYAWNDFYFSEFIDIGFFPDFFIASYAIEQPVSRWMNRLNVFYDIYKSLTININYMRTDGLTSTEVTMLNIPKHKLTAQLGYELPARFHIWGRYAFYSETNWLTIPEYPIIEIVNQSVMPAMNLVDFGITKKLCKEALQLNVSVRNVFNSQEQYMPSGARFDLRIMASILFRLDGLFAGRSAKP